MSPKLHLNHIDTEGTEFQPAFVDDAAQRVSSSSVLCDLCVFVVKKNTS